MKRKGPGALEPRKEGQVREPGERKGAVGPRGKEKPTWVKVVEQRARQHFPAALVIQESDRTIVQQIGRASCRERV